MPVDLGAFNAAIAELEQDVQQAVRPAAQAGAEVIYQAALKNVDAIGRVTGNLRSSIYQAYSPERSAPGKAVYSVSWNPRKAPHAGLVEYGHIQRYAVRLAEDGKFYTLVRPSMRGKPRPKRRASQAEKDAYYVLRAGGPVQIAAQPFMRPAANRQAEAAEAVKVKFFEVLNGV
jgi:HK97 gp10 family phage protein